MTYVPQNSSWKVEGFAELEKQLRDMAQGFRADTIAKATMVKAAKQAMEPVLADVSTHAPFNPKNTGPIHLRETARLTARIPTTADRKSIHVSPTDAVIAVVSVKRSAVSLAMEFGTSKLAARPFLRPALQANKEQVVTTLGELMGSFIIDYAKKLERKRK